MLRLEKLKQLESELRELMAKANSRSFASLSKEYRAVISEIEELEGNDGSIDEIAAIIERREKAKR